MVFFGLSALLLIFGFRLILRELYRLAGENPWNSFFKIRSERFHLVRVKDLLQEMEETLSTGLIPTSEKWLELASLKAPWGPLASESLKELRVMGGSLLPTLKRIRSLAEDHEAALIQAKGRSAQAFAQALVCFAMVPVFGAALMMLLPGVEEQLGSWIFCCLTAMIVVGAGAFWLIHIAESARWGGLSKSRRSWILSAQCAGERFLALIRSGNPADLAWTRALEILKTDTVDLFLEWGGSIWTNEDRKLNCRKGKELESAAHSVVDAGKSLKKAIQISLMEGRPCTERAEAALLALKQDFQAAIDRELTLLGTRCLKPLFLCVAPALIGLLVCGLWLSWEEVAKGGFV